MRKQLSALIIMNLSLAWGHAQNINLDSLARVMAQKDIIGKVERHSDLVQRLEWTSPWFLAPTVIAILGIAYAIVLHVWGLNKKADAILQSKEFQVKIDSLVESRVEAARKAEEQKIKGKPVCLIYLPGSGKDMRRLPKLLTDSGFTNVDCRTTEETFDIEPNTVVVFNDEDNDFTEEEIVKYIKGNPAIRSKGRYFYFGSKRLSGKEIRMRNFANSDDAFTARLYESLTFA